MHKQVDTYDTEGLHPPFLYLFPNSYYIYIIINCMARLPSQVLIDPNLVR